MNKPLFLPGVVNPFSEKFEKTWEQWRYFRGKFDNFWYKTDISQQMALNKLVEFSEGDEEKAILIVEQSIYSEWKGFFHLRNARKNGKSKQPSPKEPESSLRDQATAEFNKRNGGGEKQGNSDYLKAV
jgi:hypothetical protein